MPVKNIQPQTQEAVVYYEHLGYRGRLGNQLWQVASTYSLARKMNLEPRFNNWDYKDIFTIPASWFTPLPPAKINVEFLVPQLRPNFKSYLMDYKIIKNYIDEIKKLFTLNPSIQLTKEQLVLTGNRIAIHVRRGDFLHSNHRNKFPVMPTAYYSRALHKLPKDIPLSIFSDDIPWCKQFFNRRPALFSENNPDYIDLILMSKCKYHITANSTFSWWGALLSDNTKVITPAFSTWYGYKVIQDGHQPNLMKPPTWIEV